MRATLILPMPPPQSPEHAARARYASALLIGLDAHIKKTGELDVSLADRIERVLWPELGEP